MEMETGSSTSQKAFAENKSSWIWSNQGSFTPVSTVYSSYRTTPLPLRELAWNKFHKQKMQCDETKQLEKVREEEG